MRAPPGADEASNKEWQRSKNARISVSPKHFSGTVGNGLDRSEKYILRERKNGTLKSVPYNGMEEKRNGQDHSLLTELKLLGLTSDAIKDVSSLTGAANYLLNF